MIDADTDDLVTYAGDASHVCGGDGGQTTNASSSRSHVSCGMTVGIAGKLLVVDIQNNVIRAVNKTTKIITTVAGTVIFYSVEGWIGYKCNLKSPHGSGCHAKFCPFDFFLSFFLLFFLVSTILTEKL